METVDDEDTALLIATQGEAAALTPARERTIIRHLPYLVTLAEDGNFSRAAERLGLSQSALTRRIQALEEELGVLLFARTHRTATLTAAGRALFEDSSRIIQDLRTATRRAQLVSRGEVGELHVGLNEPAIRAAVVTAAFRSLRALYPDVKIHLHAMPSEAQVIALRRKDIDLAFLLDVALDQASRRATDNLLVARTRSLLALNEAHPLASKPTIRIADLEDQWLTWPSRRSGRSVSDGMIAAFRAAGISPNIAIEVMTEETTLNLAAANLGLGFVLDPKCVPEGVVLRRVSDYNLGMALHAVWLRDDPHAGVLRIVDELRRQIGIRGTKGMRAWTADE